MDIALSSTSIKNSEIIKFSQTQQLNQWTIHDRDKKKEYQKQAKSRSKATQNAGKRVFHSDYPKMGLQYHVKFIQRPKLLKKFWLLK